MSNSNDTVVTDSNASIEELLNEDDAAELLDLPEEPKEPKGKDNTEKEDDGEEEVDPDIKAELEDLDEDVEVEEELEYVAAPRRKEILKEYPDVFKKFPYLEKAFYKVTKFDEMFPTIDDAKVASQKATALDHFSSALMDGNIETVLAEVKRTDSNSFNKIVDNLLPALYKINPEVVGHLQRGVISKLVAGMIEDGKEQGNDAIINAAKIVKQLIFGSGNTEIKKLAQDEDPNKARERDQLTRERQQFANQKFTQTLGEVANSVSNTFKATIEANIDPRGTMSAFVKKHAVNEAIADLEKSMKTDRAFQGVVQKCWDHIWKNNYSPEAVEKLKNVSKAKGKSLLATVIRKARAEALKTGKSSTNTTRTEAKTSIKSGRVAPEQTRNERTGRRMSTLDVFMKD